MLADSNTPLAAPLVESTPLTDTIAPPINHALILDRLADVQLPAEPMLWPIFVFIVVMLIIIALIYLGYRRYQSPPPAQPDSHAQQALEKLTIVESAWANNEIDAREAAYRLSTLLRLGLNLPQLNHHCPSALADSSQAWQQTLALFNQQRYQPATTPLLTSNTFDQLRQWLSTSPYASANKPGETNV
ncbi:MAG: hypothetical protein L3J89_11700 [Gammaproteobacteria bacterium]|nr:hypothetical protein [Gammaproteobacteria bacterium]